MRVLALSDVPACAYYDCYRPGCLDEFDLILSCGDLPASYLEFVATMAHAPLVYVRGNHDDALMDEPPGGCLCAEDEVLVAGGLRILGLGGSYQYRPGPNMYTERAMARRVRRASAKIRRHGGIDVLLTHSPALGLGDLDDQAHRGFACLGELIERYEPAFFVHGHIHRCYGLGIPQLTQHGPTTIINAYDHCVFEAEPAS